LRRRFALRNDVETVSKRFRNLAADAPGPRAKFRRTFAAARATKPRFGIPVSHYHVIVHRNIELLHRSK
jgi:hypothetical protein